jgi:ferredoxin
MSDAFSSADRAAAQSAAYAAVQELKNQPTSIVEYQSKGRVIVIGDTNALAALDKLPDGLTHESFSVDALKQGETIEIEGVLGQFSVSVGKLKSKADLVLDLSASPILSMTLKPPGYIAASQYENIDAAVDELETMVGTFSKPKYFNYDESICAHGRSGKKGCTRCIDACPAEAIYSLTNLVEVDPYRCQGGGVCATVCPSGAITYAYPQPQDLLTHVRTLILNYLNSGQGAPDIAFSTEDEATRVRHAMPGALLITVEEVASVGPEIWLSALAWGAQNVWLLDLDEMPASSSHALNQNIQMTQAMLLAMGYPMQCICLLADWNELLITKSMPTFEPAKHASVGQKRQAFYLALDHLAEQAENLESVVDLPEGSIFGEVVVSPEACTLCMSCVSACPGNALQDGGELPQLGFVEARCLQCDICTNTCPEDAISISPRILLNAEKRNQRRVLHEESPFHCISCGVAFATTSGIETIISRLTGHAMFADERALTRLKMCSDCRVKDMMEDPNADL